MADKIKSDEELRRNMTAWPAGGRGIKKEGIPYIFERFYRAEKLRSRKTGGMGLGLTITKGLIEAHGGKMWVESEEAGTRTRGRTVPVSMLFLGQGDGSHVHIGYRNSPRCSRFVIGWVSLSGETVGG